MVSEIAHSQDKRLVEVARLFYREQLSKTEIANRQQISITHVNRLLRDAQQKGIVEVLIKPPRFEGLEAELSRRFKLREVRVVQSTRDPESLRKVLAEEAAEYLQPHLKNGAKVGVASGRTVFETVSAIREGPRQIEIYPLNILANSETEVKSLSANTIATVLWFKCRPLAKAFRFELFFPHQSFPEVRKSSRASLGHPESRKLRSEMGELDVYILGISELRPDSQLVEFSETCGVDLAALTSKGVVGDVAFNTIGADGNLIAIGLEDLIFQVELSDLKNASNKRDRFVVLVGGGIDKLPAIKAALAGQVFNRIVTDSDTAESLLSTLDPAPDHARRLSTH